MAIMATTQPEGITLEQRDPTSDKIPMDVDFKPINSEPLATPVEISPSTATVERNGVAHNREAVVTTETVSSSIDTLPEPQSVEIIVTTIKPIPSEDTHSSDLNNTIPALPHDSLSEHNELEESVEITAPMDSLDPVVETAIASALEDTTGPSAVPPVVEAQKSDLRDTASALALPVETHVELSPTSDVNKVTQLPSHTKDDSPVVAEAERTIVSDVPVTEEATKEVVVSEPPVVESVPAPAAPEPAVAEPTIADPMVDETIVIQPAVSTISVEQPSVVSQDVDMVEAPETTSFVKAAREREDDNDDEPSAKRPKTELDIAKTDVAAPAAEPSQERSSPAPVVAAAPKESGGRTAITDHEAKEIVKILRIVSRRKDGKNFRSPVGELWPTLADQYYAVVTNPVDFTTMENKLRDFKYATMDDFKTDVNLIYHNAVKFNGDHHAVTASAKTIRDLILEKLASIPAEPPAKPPKAPKSERKSTPVKEPSTRTPRRQSKSGAAPPATFALDPITSTPLIRRDSTKGDGRPKREIHPPNKDLPYSTAVRPKNKKVAQELKFCDEVLSELKKPKNGPFVNPFLVPVDPVSLQIPTYFNVIKHPMDISTIGEKLKNGAYQSAKAFEQDVRLIFSNCYKFNPAGNPVNQLGKQLESVFNGLWANKAKWLADHAPAAQTPSSNDDTDEEESEEEVEVEEPATGSSALAALSERLTEEQDKMIEMMKNPKGNTQMVAMQAELIELIKSKIAAAKAQPATKKTTKKAKTAKPPKKQAAPKKSGATAGKKAGRARTKYMGTHEKNVISHGIQALPEEITQEILQMIKAETEVNEGDSGEVELDIDAISTESLWKIYGYVMKYAPEAENEVYNMFMNDPTQDHNDKPAKPPAKKKNKPMSKTEQERKIQQLEGNLESFQKRASGSQEPLQTVERHDQRSPDAESSGDDSDSEEE